MFRNSTLTTLAATLLCTVGFAQAAAAIPTIALIWRDTGTDTIDPDPMDVIIADVVLTADADGVSGVFISFLYDQEGRNALDPAVLLGETGGYELPSAPPGKAGIYTPLLTGVTSNNSQLGVGGSIDRFDEQNTLGGAVSSTVTLGSIFFTYNNFQTTVTPGVFEIGIDAVLDNSGSEVDPLFLPAFVVPEPSALATAATALGALGLLAGMRRSRR